MRNFATESGKSKGQFYTPAEVSRIMASVIGINKAKNQKETIYDPTCGSGSLLLKAHDLAKTATGFDLAIYGQEMDNATAALSRMNMLIHNAAGAEIKNNNTLSTPEFKDAKTGGLKTFDYVVANPPFSVKSWTIGVKTASDEFKRFEYGVPPEKNGDYAFLLHILASLKSTGKGAVILPHGVLFRGNAEGIIRKEIVKRGYIKGIIGLPANLFYGTGIPACIIVIDKEGAAGRTGIFMIDASKGFIKDGPKNRLRERDLHLIVDTFLNQTEVDKYSRMVPITEIADAKNDYNLNLPRYIDSSEPEDLQDITGHMRGGIVLVTGPTGSGKTTTLYSALNELNQIDTKILTAEDPVEYDIEGLVQCQVNHEQELTFAKLLRSFLRQDPDIILVGEVRDKETAEMAFRAAMTGHQEHPGTGRTLEHTQTGKVSFEDLARSLGLQRVFVVDPRPGNAAVEKVIKESLEASALTLIIARRPCILVARQIREILLFDLPALHIGAEVLDLPQPR